MNSYRINFFLEFPPALLVSLPSLSSFFILILPHVYPESPPLGSNDGQSDVNVVDGCQATSRRQTFSASTRRLRLALNYLSWGKERERKKYAEASTLDSDAK